MIYISEAHVDDLWPIGMEFYLNNLKTNCNSYAPTDTARRIERAREFIKATNCSYPVFIDDENDSYNKTFQAWPDQFYFTQRDGKVLYRSQYSYREQGKIEIDCVWMLAFFQHCREKENDVEMHIMVERMVASYYAYVDTYLKNSKPEINTIAMGLEDKE